MWAREHEEGRRILPWLEPGESLLDLGAGTGFMARYLRDRRGVRPTLTDLVPYQNRDRSMPFIGLSDPLHVPVADASYDVVLMMFVFHHMDRYEDQERLLVEARRIARRRIVVSEDTPGSRFERWVNAAWDRVLNVRHGVPTPFTFRSTEEWTDVFKANDLAVVCQERYRPVWP
ncbi:MAG: class I SAM-dependent methyltransferase, partial [Actinomycetota bacterium]